MLIFGIFAVIAVVAYFCDAFMEAQLSFPGLGLEGPALLAITAVGAFFVAVCYFLQEGFSLIGVGKYLVDKMPADLVKAYSEFRGYSEVSSVDPNSASLSPESGALNLTAISTLAPASPKSKASKTVAEPEAPLTWLERLKRNLALASGSTIALGTALFWSITAFFGVLSIATAIGINLSSPYLISVAVIISVAQGAASLAQEGVNANVKLGSKPKPFLIRCVKRLAQWINPRAFREKGSSVATTNTLEGGSSDDEGVSPRDTAPLRAASPSAVKATGWRRFIPSRRTTVKLIGYLFVLAAIAGHASDFFMETQYVFVTLGMSSAVGLGILCAAVVLSACIAFYFQDGISLRDGWFSIMEWMSFKKETAPAAKPVARSKRIFLGFGSVSVSFVVVVVNGMTAFFGVIAVGIAFAGVSGAPWIIALAILAAVAQAACSASQECANLVKVATGCNTDAAASVDILPNAVLSAPTLAPAALATVPAPVSAAATSAPTDGAGIREERRISLERRKAILAAMLKLGVHALPEKAVASLPSPSDSERTLVDGALMIEATC